MQWAPQQADALDLVAKWLRGEHGDRRLFRLFGYAGVGKTTLAVEIANMVKGTTLFCSFTGKAALVMRRKGCWGASTIHRLIYKVRDNAVTGEHEFTLREPYECDLATAGLLIVDECSMVGEDIGTDLMSFGTPILVLGDPAQLPPVEGGGFFTNAKEPDVMLTQIHRQAEGNPIIKLATDVRQGQRPRRGTFKTEMGAVSVIDRRDAKITSMLAADQVLCGLNRTRRSLNAKLRAELRALGRLPPGDPPHMPVVGDKIICLRNRHDRALYNGSLWQIEEFFDRSEGSSKAGSGRITYARVKSLDEEREPIRVRIPHEFWEGKEGELKTGFKRNNDEFDYGYAITCHKSQGSQWDKVMVIDEGWMFDKMEGSGSKDMSRRWLYTAVTRAAEKLIVAI